MIAPAPVLAVTIPGLPIAQGRGRAVRIGAGVRVIDPQRSRNWKATAAEHMAVAAIQRGVKVYQGPVELVVRAYWPCPRTQYRKRQPRDACLRPKRPDGDNLLKAVQDAGQDVLWLDDAQIVRAMVEKWQAAQGEPARVEIEVREVEP